MKPKKRPSPYENTCPDCGKPCGKKWIHVGCDAKRVK